MRALEFGWIRYVYEHGQGGLIFSIFLLVRRVIYVCVYSTMQCNADYTTLLDDRSKTYE
jgi:hypothetical protein